MNAEMKDKEWLWGGIALQLGTGYTVAFLVYQIGTLITEGTVGSGFLPGLIAVCVMIGFVVFLCVNTDRKLAAKKALAGKR
jgi:ferrous iron transport protein B